MLRTTDPEAAERLLAHGQAQVALRWAEYERMALRSAAEFAADARK